MNAAVGSAGIALALAACILGAGASLLGTVRGRPQLLARSRVYAWVILASTAVAVAAMERALITRDFTVKYVAEHGSTKTPPLFNVATLWASLEGSILLWALVLAGYLVAMVTKFRSRLGDPMIGWATFVVFSVATFFFALMAGPADPFVPFDPPPGYDGPGPNPLLQNHVLMAFHPPMLYLGYVGFTVPFAFATAALITGRLGEGWLVDVRRWTLVAWSFLTAGILFGAWWSYEVLGWGGYWAWDPVENASLLPWLTATAYLHSVMVQERRGLLRVWNLSLLSATFALTILGTFITRSGVLESVHSFTESDVGPWFLALLGLSIFVPLSLIAWRGDVLRSGARRLAPLSREGAFLYNNLLFAAFALVVFVGTVFPLVVEALTGDRISVGVPYFDRMSAPIGMGILLSMAVAPVMPWRAAPIRVLADRLHWPAWAGTITLVLAVVIGERSPWVVSAYGLAVFAGASAARQLWLAVSARGVKGLAGRTGGGMISHLGLAMVGLALVASRVHLRSAEIELRPGDRVQVAGHEIRYVRPEFLAFTNRTEARALVTVDGDGPYTPAVVRFDNAGASVGRPSVRVGLLEDVQLSLFQAPGDDGSIGLRVVVQPLILLLWVGGGVTVLGGLLAAVPSRERREKTPNDQMQDEASPRQEGEPTGVAVGGTR
ncbi:MAG: cytochrome c biogenesis protein CcmF [Acidimicrobiales bacterium]|nr:MAG: cytochrome c biogenesis protein CcmF [Acidimicrobiales bacterium]